MKAAAAPLSRGKPRARPAKSAPRSPATSIFPVADATNAARADVSLWVRLLECHNLMLAEVRTRLKGRSTMPRFDLLANLAREDGQTLVSLSRRMLVTAGNLTGLVDRAERDGAVERRSDPADRRMSRVFLTPRGRRLVDGLLPAHASHVAELLHGLEGSERRELRRVLGKLRDLLRGRRVFAAAARSVQQASQMASES